MAPPAPTTFPAMAEFDTPTNNLWVGNLTPDVTEAELASLFGRFGQVDCITSYPARSYAFVHFNALQGALAAKEALQGTFLRGSPLRIDFAKPAKPCKSLRVAGIGQSVSKEELEDHFKKFGNVLELKFVRDRNTAYIDYARLEDATEALKNMHGKKINGDQIRVDYVRSHPARREQGLDFPKEGQFPYRGVLQPDFMKPYSEPFHAGSKRQHFEHQLPPPGGRRESQPSKILCISYPPSAHIEEDMLHNAMILFGEIERIKTFDDRNHALVEFRSVEEAILAKEGLQGKLFNDPRISIEYSSSGFPPTREYFAPHSQMGILDHNLPLLPNNNIPGHLPHGIHGLDMLMRPLGPQNRLDHGIPISEYPDLALMHKLQESNPHNLMGGSEWGRSSPVTGVYPSGVLKPLSRPTTSSGWDVYDAGASQVNRESKRSRVESALPHYDVSLPPQRLDGQSLALDERFGVGSAANIRGRHHPPRVTPGHDYVWRGLIAKGGTPVCRARCVPIGDEIESEIPDVVNCSARTGLDLLTKHYADAVGFKIVFFLPDSEEDFSSYTEFLRYLGTKNRAGVAKFNDGTTLFLVPPSDFLRNVLSISGPERLYGVVLEFPQTTATSVPPPPLQMDTLQPPYADAQMTSYHQTPYNSIRPEDLRNEYKDVVLREEVKLPPKTVGPPTSISLPLHSAPPSINTSTPPRSGVTLTPELIATLTSLLPLGNPSSSQNTTSSTLGPVLDNTSVAPPDQRHGPQGWGYEQQTHFNTQAQPLPPAQVHAPVFNVPPSHEVAGFSQNLDQHPFDFQMQTTASFNGLTSAHMAGPLHVGQHNPHGVSQSSLLQSPGLLRSDASVMYGSTVLQQPNQQLQTHSVPNQGVNPQPHAIATLPVSVAAGGIMAPPQQLHSGVGLESVESEESKNERYRTTLMFAANLLSQIQQQQPNSQSGQGS
ncbi:hypothetical protein DM860_005727 [Cuscuta australis]|uniref:RRM domain-containing protein n=1 Tax=Cuscuta australis TaxID=267555 RepID=A0A328DW39_9ASTE|nr:hypothetical protein DM860_005727 [Cuscuta australis]